MFNILDWRWCANGSWSDEGTVADVENNGMREQETGRIRDNCAFLNDLTSERQLYNSKCCSGDS